MLKGSNRSVPWRDSDGKLTDKSWLCIAVKILLMFSVMFLSQLSLYWLIEILINF